MVSVYCLGLAQDSLVGDKLKSGCKMILGWPLTTVTLARLSDGRGRAPPALRSAHLA